MKNNVVKTQMGECPIPLNQPGWWISIPTESGNSNPSKK